ncbi:MAG: Small-conductance mechanosensitive channel [Alphaproteobacteria bacterium MarineAlpha3_Bin3]|nr:MAG: Small-conductance mechanosensitive channel [Alphaproteobacteria bacterium MarineAlpha3_Bin3]
MDKQTQEIIEGVVAITIEYGVDIVGAIVLLIIGWTVAGWARRGVRHALERVPRMDETLKPFLAKLVWYVIMAFVLVAVLSQFGVQTTSVIAVLGAAGLAIGLALQGTLANVASGVMLLFLRPFNIGDYVDAGGIAGTVVEIGLFNTEIKTRKGLCLIVPNKIIWESPITNFSRNPTRRFDITVGISYGDDVNGATDLLMGLLTGDERILDDPEPLAVVEELGDSAVIINLRAWTRAEDFWAAVWDLKKAIKVEFEVAGYSIPFPQRDIHIVSGDLPG